MKRFFHDYSYSVVKMFVNQFAIAIFGISLTTATKKAHADSIAFDWLSLIVSIFAALFYLFLLYTQTWEIGAKDRISVDCGKKKYRPHLGLLLSFFANVPNLVLGVVHVVLSSINEFEYIGMAACLLQAMYFGIINTVSLPIGGEWVTLMSLWPTFFLMSVPAMLTCWLAYFMGFKNIRIIAKAPKKAETNKDRPNMKK